jgi:hypothetical protein
MGFMRSFLRISRREVVWLFISCRRGFRLRLSVLLLREGGYGEKDVDGKGGIRWRSSGLANKCLLKEIRCSEVPLSIELLHTRDFPAPLFLRVVFGTANLFFTDLFSTLSSAIFIKARLHHHCCPS